VARPGTGEVAEHGTGEAGTGVAEEQPHGADR
jgi:hypothetical protein